MVGPPFSQWAVAMNDAVCFGRTGTLVDTVPPSRSRSRTAVSSITQASARGTSAVQEVKTQHEWTKERVQKSSSGREMRYRSF